MAVKFMSNWAVSLTFAICIAIGGVNPSGAAPLHPVGWDAACDDQILADMQQRAWMETQRELESNAYYIHKPDSVLQLSCFSQQVRRLYGQGGWFSEATIGTATRNTNLDTQMTSAVIDAVAEYVGSSFNYPGTGGNNLNGGHGGISYSAGGGDWYCDEMLNVWQDNSCQNVDMTHFLTLKQIADGGDTDMRHGPAFGWYNCEIKSSSATSTSYSGNLGGHGQDQDTDTLWETRYEDVTELIAAEADFIVTSFDFTLPLDASISFANGTNTYTGGPRAISCDPATGCTVNRCMDPIPTGLVTRSGSASVGHVDAICPNPGCSLVPDEVSSGVLYGASTFGDIGNMLCVPSKPAP